MTWIDNTNNMSICEYLKNGNGHILVDSRQYNRCSSSQKYNVAVAISTKLSNATVVIVFFIAIFFHMKTCKTTTSPIRMHRLYILREGVFEEHRPPPKNHNLLSVIAPRVLQVC